jgi:hypothetical protein
MKLVFALVGLAALGGVALSTASASAMPVAIPGQAAHASEAAQASNVIQTDYVCNGWGHCWDHPSYDGGYFHPHTYGGGWGWHHGWGGGRHHWHPHYDGGWGYGGGWHHWHPHYYGGWGYGGRWHHWHQW